MKRKEVISQLQEFCLVGIRNRKREPGIVRYFAAALHATADEVALIMQSLSFERGLFDTRHYVVTHLKYRMNDPKRKLKAS